MPEIRLTKNVVMGGKIFLKGEVVTIPGHLESSLFGELVSPEIAPDVPDPPATPKRSRTKSDPKPEPEVTEEDGTGDNP